MNLIEVETSELSGAALDWAVAKATGALDLKIGADGGISCIYQLPEGGCWTQYYRPSTEWSEGGPLIDKHCSEVSSRSDVPFADGPWGASVTSDPDVFWMAPTPLVAVCRAVVASKLGRTVQVPAALVEVAHG